MSKRPTMTVMLEKAQASRAEKVQVSLGAPMTKRQRQIFDFIKRHVSKFGFPPTCAEIAESFGFTSCNAAFQHLNLIEKKGYIKRDSNVARAIRIIEEPA